jgi:UDP-3-O-acyl N-acetylglucosamine deacetylase
MFGVGFVTGAAVHIRFHPAPPSTGIVFIRTDLNPPVFIPAQIEHVTDTLRRTTLGHAPAHASLVEHVLAALAGLRIDNCFVNLDAPEPPGLDGSAQGFVEALQQAGAVIQGARRATWSAVDPVVVTQNGATLALHPPEGDEFKISYTLDYGLNSPIDRQRFTEVITPENFASAIAGSRTFILEKEDAELRRLCSGTRTTTADLLVFGPHGVIGNRLRHADEPARHKILDLVGDLSLLGQDLCGHLVAYRSGHRLNIELVRVLTRQMAGQGFFCQASSLAA